MIKNVSSGLGNFKRLLISEVSNTTASSIATIATPIIAITYLHASPIEVGMLVAASTGGPLVFGLSAGAIADRMHRGRLMVCCGIVRLLLMLLVPILYGLDALSIYWLYFVGFGLSTVKLLFDSAMSAAIPTLVERENLMQANSWYEASNSTAATLGPALCGWLLQLTSFVAVYFVNSILYLLSSLVLRPLPLAQQQSHDSVQRTHLQDITDGLLLLWKNPVQRSVAISAGFFNLFHTAFFTVFTLFALNVLGFSPATLGMVISLIGIVGLLAAWWAPGLIKKLGLRIALVGSLVIIGPLGLPILFAGNLTPVYAAGLIALCLGAWDFVIVVHLIIEQSLRQVTVPRTHLSRITSTTRFISWGGDPLGALLGGIAATSVLGLRGTLLLCLVGMSIAGALLLLSSHIRSLRADMLLSKN